MRRFKSKYKRNNDIITFDLETTSWRTKDGVPRAIAYAYGLSVKGKVTIDRTEADFVKTLNNLGETYKGQHVIIWVHNLPFDYQFVKDILKPLDVFAVGNRRAAVRVMAAINGALFEFRCSYKLSGLSLDNLAKSYKLPTTKGDYDYKKIRHNATPLTADEVDYIKRDLIVTDQGVREIMKVWGIKSPHKLPLTSTGFVRRECRRRVLADADYLDVLSEMPEDDNHEYIRKAYTGGYTHADGAATQATLEGKPINNVVAYDIGSSYPAAMVSRKFPVSRLKGYGKEDGESFTFEEIEKLKSQGFGGVLTIEIHDFTSNSRFPYFSESRTDGDRLVVDNGRVFSGKRAAYIITTEELDLVRRNYKFNSYKIGQVLLAEMDYLPAVLVDFILELYEKKTTLKGAKPGTPEALEYLTAKTMINSVYGMTARRVFVESFSYDQTTGEVVQVPPPTPAEVNKERGRFMPTSWAPFVTAHAKARLFEFIHTMEEKLGLGAVLYCDTDSVYIHLKNKGDEEKVEAVREELNDQIMEATAKALKTPEKIKQSNPAKGGKNYPIGTWELDGRYVRFATLGAKRYLTEEAVPCFPWFTKRKLTVAGLAKSAVGVVDFDNFTEDLVVDVEKSGRMTHYYSDEPFTEEITDYLGNTSEVSASSYIMLENVQFSLGLSGAYLEFLQTMAGAKANGCQM